MNLFLLVPMYLMSNYLYSTGVDDGYQPLLSDAEYDKVCCLLKKHWDKIEHYHKEYIDYDSLESATGSYLDFNKLPKRIASAAIDWYMKGLTEEQSKILNMEVDPVEKKPEQDDMQRDVFVVSSHDVESILTAKVIVDAIPHPIHLSASRNKPNQFNPGSIVYLIKGYKDGRWIRSLTESCDVIIIDYTNSKAFAQRNAYMIDRLKDKHIFMEKDKFGKCLYHKVWERFFPNKQEPVVFDILTDYVNWLHKDPRSIHLFYALELLQPLFKNDHVYQQLFDNDPDELDRLIMDGEAVSNFLHAYHAELIKELAFEATIAGKTVLAANIPRAPSLVFEEHPLMSHVDLLCTFGFMHFKHEYHHTLYQVNEEVRCVDIAKQFRGFGHASSAGFQSKVSPFKNVQVTSTVTDHTKLLNLTKSTRMTPAIIRYITTKLTACVHMLHYGKYNGVKAVLLNSPYITEYNYFAENNSDAEATVGVAISVLGNGKYRISARPIKDDNKLPEEFGTDIGCNWRTKVVDDLSDIEFFAGKSCKYEIV